MYLRRCRTVRTDLARSIGLAAITLWNTHVTRARVSGLRKQPLRYRLVAPRPRRWCGRQWPSHRPRHTRRSPRREPARGRAPPGAWRRTKGGKREFRRRRTRTAVFMAGDVPRLYRRIAQSRPRRVALNLLQPGRRTLWSREAAVREGALGARPTPPGARGFRPAGGSCVPRPGRARRARATRRRRATTERMMTREA